MLLAQGLSVLSDTSATDGAAKILNFITQTREISSEKQQPQQQYLFCRLEYRVKSKSKADYNKRARSQMLATDFNSLTN